MYKGMPTGTRRIGTKILRATTGTHFISRSNNFTELTTVYFIVLDPPMYTAVTEFD